MDESTLFGQIVTILAVVLSLGIVPLGIYFDHRKRTMVFAERRLMIERGMSPPPLIESKPFPFNREPRSTGDPRALVDGCLRKGITLASAGAGFWLADAVLQQRLTMLDSDIGRPLAALFASGSLAAAGTVLGLLGAGNLVYFALARGRFRSS